jgi:hypothetical protein
MGIKREGKSEEERRNLKGRRVGLRMGLKMGLRVGLRVGRRMGLGVGQSNKKQDDKMLRG